MAKALIRRYLPDPETIRQQRALGPLRHRLGEPALWLLNRRSAARACFWGLFAAFLPMPMQMLPAALAAIVTRSNLPLTLLLVWASNPVTIVPQLFGGWWLGSILLAQPGPDLAHLRHLLDAGSHALFAEALHPLLVGLPLLGLLIGGLGYLLMHAWWRWQVVKAWRHRHPRRQTGAQA